MSTDTPSGYLDNESANQLVQLGANPVCGVDVPISIEARVVATQEDYSSTGQTVSIHPKHGFWCENAENEPNCLDYEVRFCCP